MKRIIRKINSRIPVWIRKNRVTAEILVIVYGIILHVDKDFNEQIKKAALMYRDKRVSKVLLYHDMIYEYIRSWVLPVEYAKFELYGKKRKERDLYIPDHEEIVIFKKTKGNNTLPDSKYDRYIMFNNYFHREVLCISDKTNISNDEYKQFMSGKESVVVKPLQGTKGHGVEFVSTKQIPSVQEFKKLYNNCLIEECIRQGDELKQFHPNSINTVRFVTGINFSGEFHYLFALIRFGQGKSIIDNVGSGGLIALIDMKTGEICTPACCGTSRYVCHPDTKVMFQGFAIPRWDELCLLVRDMHLNHPGQRIFGFDMAWTEEGWDLVEVNPAPSLSSYQELTGVGIRPYLQSVNII